MIKRDAIQNWDRKAQEVCEEAKTLGGHMFQGFLRGSSKRKNGTLTLCPSLIQELDDVLDGGFPLLLTCVNMHVRGLWQATYK